MAGSRVIFGRLSTQVFPNQIKIAHKTAILATQMDIDTSVLQCPENSARQLRVRKQIAAPSVVDIGSIISVCAWRITRRGNCQPSSHQERRRREQSAFAGSYISVIARISSAQSCCVVLMSTKFNLARSVSREDFVETKVELVVPKLCHERTEGE